MTYILAATRETALKLAGLILAGKIPPMAATLGEAEALRQLHPRPLRYGLAIYATQAGSVVLVAPSELSQLTSKLGEKPLGRGIASRAL